MVRHRCVVAVMVGAGRCALIWRALIWSWAAVAAQVRDLQLALQAAGLPPDDCVVGTEDLLPACIFVLARGVPLPTWPPM
eukprot:654457-Prymnesium_polylepis.2